MTGFRIPKAAPFSLETEISDIGLSCRDKVIVLLTVSPADKVRLKKFKVRHSVVFSDRKEK